MNMHKAIIALRHKSNILRQFSSVTKNPSDKNRQPSCSKVADSSKDANSDKFSIEKDASVLYYRDQKTVNDVFNAKKLIRKYNETVDEDYQGKRKILGDLLNPACRDKQLVIIEQPFYTLFGYNLTVGENFYSNVDCYFEDSAPITIGYNCLIAPGVHIYTGTHPVDRKDRLEYSVACQVQIGNDVWIGGGSIVCPGVTIGDNVVIGAGSLVETDIPSNVIVGGNPAEIIRHLEVK